MSETDHREQSRAQRARDSHGVHPGYDEKSRLAITTYVDRYGDQHEGLLRKWLALSDAVADVLRFREPKSLLGHQRVTLQ